MTDEATPTTVEPAEELPADESSLVKHARRELEIIGEEQSTIDGILKIMQDFSDMGHSGGSASVIIPVLHELFQYHNLSPLTNNPDEWFHHEGDVWGEPGGIWQNIRNSEAFSYDGGKTYYQLWEVTEDAEGNKVKTYHTSKVYLK